MFTCRLHKVGAKYKVRRDGNVGGRTCFWGGKLHRIRKSWRDVGTRKRASGGRKHGSENVLWSATRPVCVGMYNLVGQWWKERRRGLRGLLEVGHVGCLLEVIPGRGRYIPVMLSYVRAEAVVVS